MEVLSSRVLLRPRDLARSVRFYEETLGLPVYREWGSGAGRCVVFFTGGGFLEVSGRGSGIVSEDVAVWLQVRDVDLVTRRLREAGVPLIAEPETKPWGLREAEVSDPDGLRLVLVEVPPDHPLRRRA